MLISKICAYFQGQCLKKRVTCLVFLSPVLVFDFIVQKIGYCGREDLFFDLHQFLVEKQDFVDVKTFFFFSLHQFLVYSQ